MPHSGPLVISLPPGRHAICRCGKTGKAPLCDGSHKGSGLAPEIVDLQVPTPLAWCLCRTSGRMPRCDGSHKRL